MDEKTSSQELLGIDLDEWEFEFQQRDEHPILMADFWCRASARNFEQELGFKTGSVDYIYTDLSRAYVKKSQKKKILDHMSAASDDYLRYIIDSTKKRVHGLESFAKELNSKELNDLTSQELAALWAEFDKIFCKLIPWLFIPWYVAEKNVLSDRVEKMLEHHRQEIEKITGFSNAVMILIFPDKEVEFQKEKNAFCGLVQLAKKSGDFGSDPGFSRKADDYLKRYSWMKTFVLLPKEPLTKAELVDNVKKAAKTYIPEEYSAQEKQAAENKRLQDSIFSIIRDDSELRSLVALSKEFGWLLTWSVDHTLMICVDCRQFFKEVSSRANIGFKDWIHFTSEELCNALKGNPLPGIEELEKRKNGFVLLVEGGVQKLVAGPEAHKLSKEIDSSVGSIDYSADTLTGKTAFQGKVKGNVRVALFAKDSSKVKDDEILVCPMTCPEYISAMKRASAIITDEGGLLSHAAIISREFKTPCIVGTRHATKLLKDGDEIDVDADKGIIKIIKRKSS